MFGVQSLTFKVESLRFASAPEERHVYRTEAPPQPATLFIRQNGKRRTDVGVGRSTFGIAPEERHVYRTEAPPQPATLFTRQNVAPEEKFAVQGSQFSVQSSQFTVES
jgi:hypothetical protein